MTDQEPDGIKLIAKNRKAFFEYDILERYEAGILLQGTEVKSLRNGKVSLGEAYAVFRGDELYIINLDIAPYTHGNMNNHEPKRARKLLMHARELAKLKVRIEERGFTLIPIRMYFKRGWAKVELGLGKGKTHGDKRENIKKRDIELELKRQFRIK